MNRVAGVKIIMQDREIVLIVLQLLFHIYETFEEENKKKVYCQVNFSIFIVFNFVSYMHSYKIF